MVYDKEEPNPLNDPSGVNGITWVFDAETFVPCAKLEGGKTYSIICDHLGTPKEAYDAAGKKVWDCVLDIYGRGKMINGNKNFIPFRYQGQYEDVETGLYYNRFRYYSPEEGMYISQDPLGLDAGLKFYSYVPDVNLWVDVLGLILGGSYYRVRKANLGGEVNHIPAHASYKGIFNSPSHSAGPTIWMEYSDHRQTKSCGSSRDAKIHRAQQRGLINRGNWAGAIEMDIIDIKGKFNKKYDKGLKEMIDYAKSKNLITTAQQRKLKAKCK
jgi:RHS repeat-associated protein